MVQLNISMPKQCVYDCCPCLTTLMMDEKYFRVCQAAKMKIIYACDKEGIYSNEWMHFKKPDWCPLIEVPYESYEEEESRWHMSMAGLGGSYEYE